MSLIRRVARGPANVAAVAVLLALVWSVPGVAAADTGSGRAGPAFAEVDLVSDVPGAAALTDPHVVNAWGLAFGPATPLWVANNGTDTATLYAGGINGAAPTIVPLVVSVPGAPTGQAFNGGTGFVVTGSAGSGPARFLFVTESGDLLGWSPAADPTHAIVAAHVRGAIYKGLTMAATPFGLFLLAADFAHGRIDVFDSTFKRVRLPAPFFTDRLLPHGYAPFNVAFLDGRTYVTYAKQTPGSGDETAGPGLGFVDVYGRFGLLQRRIASRGALNAPWGLAIAPPSFGKFAGHLLVGNFGDGRISVYDRSGRGFDGQLRDVHRSPLVIDGLWALLPGTAATGGTDAVWFSAGPDDESHGLVGQIRRAVTS